ncbi:MAG: outer membrane protein assembly factor BamD [Calditerrivibrio sp.]|nr:outer membrane protein assembly factor BamD [Calditerrivibrio sp.]
MKRFGLLSIIFLVLLIVACSSKEPPKRPAEEWLKEGLEYFQKKKYQKAAEALENAIIESDSPEIAAQAQLLLGDSYFFMKEYEQAIPSYKEYLNIHPDSHDAKRAMYRLALSYYNQIDTVDRDQENTELALKTFEQLKDKYPDFAAENKVDKKILELKNMLAEKELYVAKFYFRIKEPNAAIRRLEYLVKHFKGTKSYPEGLIMLAEQYVDKPEKAKYVVELLTELAKTKEGVVYLDRISSVLARLEKALSKK